MLYNVDLFNNPSLAIVECEGDGAHISLSVCSGHIETNFHYMLDNIFLFRVLDNFASLTNTLERTRSQSVLLVEKVISQWLTNKQNPKSQYSKYQFYF